MALIQTSFFFFNPGFFQQCPDRSPCLSSQSTSIISKIVARVRFLQWNSNRVPPLWNFHQLSMVFMIAFHLQIMPCEGYYLIWDNTFSPTVTTQPVGHMSALQVLAQGPVALLTPLDGGSCHLQKAFPKTSPFRSDLDENAIDGDATCSLFVPAIPCISLCPSISQPRPLFPCLPHCTMNSLRARNGFSPQRAGYNGTE